MIFFPYLISTLIVLFFSAFFYFATKRTLRYLRFLQQESYYNLRFLKWVFASGSFDKRGTLGVLCATFFIILFTYFYSGFVSHFNFLPSDLIDLKLLSMPLKFYAISFLIVGYLEQNPIKFGKIKLVLTQRAKRILYVSIFLTAIVALIIIKTHFGIFCTVNNPCSPFVLAIKLILLIQFLPLSLVLSNLILSPYEKYVQNSFLNEAKAKLANINPYIIGITGSYGKTSTKNALTEILNTALAPTFTTPKSYNSIMGIVKVIRENLSNAHKYAVIEMGAYHQGSIAKLCKFTPPKAGILTCVGLAHLERHKNEESIYIAKSELPQAIPQDGILVCNGDNSGSRRAAKEYRKDNTYLYGFDNSNNDLDCLATEITPLDTGSSFKLHWKGKTYEVETKLNGETSISNLLACFTMACALGANPEYVVAVIRSIKPVDNRLDVKNEGDNFIIHDAYNSNPVGFMDALKKLKEHKESSRKILMTPGMVELGNKQFSENQKVAEFAGSFCDKAIIVAETNREALRSGLLKGGMKEENILIVNTRDEAFSTFFSQKTHKDILLIENDLTDNYEVEEKF